MRGKEPKGRRKKGHWRQEKVDEGREK